MESDSSLTTTFLISAVPLVLVGGSYIFFIIASLAMTRSRITRLEELQVDGSFGADQALAILERSEAYLLCAQVGRFLSSLVAGIILATLMRDLSTILPATAQQAPWYAILAGVFLFVIFVSAMLVMVQIGKACALQFPERVLCIVALPLRVAYTLFGPIVVFVHGAVSRVLGRFNIKRAHERDLALSADDLSEIVRMGSRLGAIEKDEQNLLEGVVELSGHIVREVMTPRTDIVYVRESNTTAEVVAVFQRETVSRVLVCGVDLDDVKGLLLAKDLIRFVGHGVTPDAWREYVRLAHFVPNTKRLDELLQELRQRSVHLAVVLDEHGGVDGLVTLEDLVEEIVGDISDEFDKPSDQQEVVHTKDGTLVVDGGVSIDELSEQHGVELPEGEYDTVAGFVLAQLGHVPVRGEKVLFNEVEITVNDVHHNRVVKVGIRRLPAVSNESDQQESVLAGDGAPRRLEESANSSRTLRISQLS